MNPLPVIDLTATGKNILRLRKQAGVSVKTIQDALGFSSPQAIYKWQSGKALPTLDNLVALAALLRVSIDEIIICRDSFRIVLSA